MSGVKVHFPKGWLGRLQPHYDVTYHFSITLIRTVRLLGAHLVAHLILKLFLQEGNMTEQIGAAKPAVFFEYELFEGDPDYLRTVKATQTQAGPWIDPSSLKLKHRIGRGPFGDVFLATHHQLGHDFEEYHEVAVKMLHPLKEGHTKHFLDKFEDLFSKCRGLQCVCWLHGISVVNGKVTFLINDSRYLLTHSFLCLAI